LIVRVITTKQTSGVRYIQNKNTRALKGSGAILTVSVTSEVISSKAGEKNVVSSFPIQARVDILEFDLPLSD